MRVPEPGHMFAGKYQVHERLGKGGFASVFRARDVEVQRDVAIKVLMPTDGRYPGGIEARFMVEARVIAGLQDPHTIRLFEFGKTDDGLLYMVFQYVAGRDLGVVLDRQGALPPETAVHVAKQVLAALAEAHAVDVLHRDIKPGNVLIHEYSGDPHAAKLLDFGIAKVDAGAGGVGLTKTGAMLGTPRYMAPEQVFGEQLTPATDIFGVGLIMIEMLTGQPAVQGNQREILEQHAAEMPVARLAPHVGWPALRLVVERMVARDPRERFGSAQQAIAALDEAVRMRSQVSQPVVVDPWSASSSGGVRTWSSSERIVPTTPQDTTRPGAPARSVWMAGVPLGLLVAVIAGSALFARDEAPPPPMPAHSRALPNDLLRSAEAPLPPMPRDEPATPDVGVTSRDAGILVRKGCGTVPRVGQEHVVELSVFARRALVLIPPDYDPQVRYPVILAFQPRYYPQDLYLRAAGLRDLVDREPVIVASLEPEARVDPWDEGLTELETVRSTVDAVDAEFCIDRARVFATGHGDGAKMARRLPCALPLAGLALTGFAEKSDKPYCEPVTAVPVLLVQGRDDLVMPMEGGEGCTTGPFFTYARQIANWRERNRCEARSARWSKDAVSECVQWACETPVVTCLADGGHHLAKTELRLLYPTCPNDTLNFDHGPHIWRFFESLPPVKID